ncbi:MAG: hypothetical protein LBH40_03090 [Alphaproteobacteria bacterium]|jgi:hypothetical protein|nr:hypothetical protein [Alphaproteobacteria bacterium]
MANRCASCDGIIDGSSMNDYKAKCKDCGDLYCDSCFEDNAEETTSGEWKVMECDCGGEIWRKQ